MFILFEFIRAERTRTRLIARHGRMSRRKALAAEWARIEAALPNRPELDALIARW